MLHALSLVCNLRLVYGYTGSKIQEIVLIVENYFRTDHSDVSSLALNYIDFQAQFHKQPPSRCCSAMSR